MFLKFHGSILSEIVLITICLEQKGLKPPIKKLYNLVFKLEEATQRKSQEKNQKRESDASDSLRCVPHNRRYTAIHIIWLNV